MAGIPIISNFDVNSYSPIDSRMVVANAATRTSLSYLYEGLKVYQTDTKVTWVYKGTGWFVDGNGIYGGSGSLIGDTYVSTGSIGTTSGSQSYAFILTTNTSGLNPYLSTYFNRHSPGSDWTDVEVTTSFQNDITSGGGINKLSWVTYNAYDWSGSSLKGNIDYYINTSKTLTISKNSLIIWNPTYSATIKLTSLNSNYTYNLPNQGGTFAMVSDLSNIGVSSFIQNGNIFGGTANLGTNDNQSLQFKTYNVTRMTIGTNGNIGIGTSSDPSSTGTKLIINGDSHIYGYLQSTFIKDITGSTGSFGQLLSVTGGGNQWINNDFTKKDLIISKSSNFTVDDRNVFYNLGSGSGTITIPPLSSEWQYKIWNHSGSTWTYSASGGGVKDSSYGIISTIPNNTVHVLQTYQAGLYPYLVKIN